MPEIDYNGDWEDVKKRLMDKYPSLTEKDFTKEDHQDKLLNHLSQELGKTTDEMRKIIRHI